MGEKDIARRGGEGHKAVDQVIAVVALSGDMQREVDLGRSKDPDRAIGGDRPGPCG